MSAQVDLDECYAVAVELSKKASNIVKEACSREKRVSSKNTPADLVTETDQLVEQLLIQSFKEKFPSHSFIGEESVSAGEKCSLTDDPTWIIDPIDGTCNFVHMFPFAAVSIALFVNKKPVIGIVHNVLLDLMYHARVGQGAYCNDKKLQIGSQTDLSQCLLATELGIHQNDELRAFIRRNLERLGGKIHGIRCTGSAAMNMCHVAAGMCDGYFEFGIHVWDIAAGILIVEEAGGVCVDTNGEPLDPMNRRVIAANNQTVALQLATSLEQIEMERD